MNGSKTHRYQAAQPSVAADAPQAEHRLTHGWTSPFAFAKWPQYA